MNWPEVLAKFAWFVFCPLDDAGIGMKVWLELLTPGPVFSRHAEAGPGPGLVTVAHWARSHGGVNTERRCHQVSSDQQPEKWTAYKLLHASVKWDGLDPIHQEVSVTIFSGWSYLK